MFFKFSKLIKSLLLPLFVIYLYTFPLYASGTLTGTLTTPSTSVPLSNILFTFNLSQAGVDVTSTYNLATTPITCATSSTGSVVGIRDPLIAPVASASISGGTYSGTYYVKITYTDSVPNHTAPSPSLTVNVSGGNNAITITAPVLHPFGALGYNVYVGTVSGSEKLQSTVSGFGNVTLTTYNASGTAIPSTNTSACNFTFNDSIIPLYTTYRVSAITSNGVSVSGFPQNWYLTGTSVNIATIIPVSNINARFQNPILSNPLSSYATQSINSPLTLNGYTLTAGIIAGQGGLLEITGNVGLSTLTPAYKLDVQTSGNITQLRLLDTGNGTATTDGLLIFDTTTGVGLNNQDATPIFLYTTGLARFEIDSVGHYGPYGNNGTTSVVPNAGTSALDTGSNDSAGRINQSVAGASSIVLTFGATFANTSSKPPSCTAQNETTTQAVRATASTTTLTLTGTIASGDKVTYQCIRFGS